MEGVIALTERKRKVDTTYDENTDDEISLNKKMKMDSDVDRKPSSPWYKVFPRFYDLPYLIPHIRDKPHKEKIYCPMLCGWTNRKLSSCWNHFKRIRDPSVWKPYCRIYQDFCRAGHLEPYLSEGKPTVGQAWDRYLKEHNILTEEDIEQFLIEEEEEAGDKRKGRWPKQLAVFDRYEVLPSWWDHTLVMTKTEGRYGEKIEPVVMIPTDGIYGENIDMDIPDAPSLEYRKRGKGAKKLMLQIIYQCRKLNALQPEQEPTMLETVVRIIYFISFRIFVRS